MINYKSNLSLEEFMGANMSKQTNGGKWVLSGFKTGKILLY